jgi:hypothetical protein
LRLVAIAHALGFQVNQREFIEAKCLASPQKA